MKGRSAETPLNTPTTVQSSLHILPEQTLSLIQKKFNEMFPYLRLEFFSSKVALPFGKIKPLNPETTIAKLDKFGTFSIFDIAGDQSVKSLEKTFFDQFNVQLKVLRKSGKTWLETSLTNEWSLDFQNSQGRELSRYTE